MKPDLLEGRQHEATPQMEVRLDRDFLLPANCIAVFTLSASAIWKINHKQ